MSKSVIQFSGEQTRNSLKVVASWVHALTAGSDINSVVSDFCSLFGADGAQIVRQMRFKETARLVARHEFPSCRSFSRPLRSFASLILDADIHRANPGSVWLLSEANPRQDTYRRLEELKIKEVTLVVLGSERDHSDFLELHHGASLRRNDHMLLEMLGPVFSQAWKNRAPGIVEALLAGRPFPVAQESAVPRQILGPNNPVGLTRSEYRICSLIQGGNLPDQIAEILGVRKSTLQSHMSAIYLKTGASGQLALVHMLRNYENIDHGAVGS